MYEQGQGRYDSLETGRWGDSIMIVLIDNYDSFTYNLYQLLGQFDESIKVIRNDALTVDDVAALKADHIVISPGPDGRLRRGFVKTS